MLRKVTRFLGLAKYFILALAIGAMIFEVSFIGGVASFTTLAVLLPNSDALDYYETVTAGTYLTYVLIVSVLICLSATSRARRQRLVGVFLIAAAMFWLIHDALPLGIWLVLGLVTIAALPMYQILVQRARH